MRARIKNAIKRKRKINSSKRKYVLEKKKPCFHLVPVFLVSLSFSVSFSR